MKHIRQYLLYFAVTVILVIGVFAPVAHAADNTKSQGTLMDWTVLDDTAATPTTETNELDSGEGLNDAVLAFLHIDMCHSNNSAAGDAAGVSILIKSGTTDEDWHELVRFPATGGTANVGNCNDTTASGQAVIELTSTTNFETPGDIYFLKDEGTLADSCLVMNQGTYADDDWITVIDDLVNAYDADDNLYDIVDQWMVALPSSIQACKVLFYNTDADANYACRVKYTMVTDIE